jgi:PAS domain S-box-containing protein
MGRRLDSQTFAQKLHAARDRGAWLQERVLEAVERKAVVPEMLEELSTVLEELRVSEDELLAHHELITEGWQSVVTRLDQHRMLFELAPAASLITDAVGVIQQANRRAASLLGVDQQFLVGRPLVLYVATHDRQRLWERLNMVDTGDTETWRLRLQPRGRDPVPVIVATTVACNQAEGNPELHWQFLELPTSSDRAADKRSKPSAIAALSAIGDPDATRPGGDAPRVEAPSSPRSPHDVDYLAVALHRVMQVATPLLRADDVGLLLVGQDGSMRLVAPADQPEQAVVRAERDLGAGPSIDAFASGEVVWTADLSADPRWPRLGPVARDNQVRGVLAAPVGDHTHPLGICKASTRNPRSWTDGDIEAITAFASILAQVISSVTYLQHIGELAAHLQVALESRVLIEQAKGMLMERHGLSDGAAFERLRLHARSSSRKLTEVARELLTNRQS